MAAFETSATAPMGAVSTQGILKFVATRVEAMRDWNDRRVTRKALSNLSDRELDDIGLCRGDVELIGL
jgi:uncharacterized protein YjiS (DUF1127 family)